MLLKMFGCSVSKAERDFIGYFDLKDVLVNNADDMSQDEIAAFTQALETEGKARILGCVGHYAEFENAFSCIDCKADTSAINEYYMVTDELWAKADMTPEGGMLCIGCLEKRIGRQLVAKDFPAYPVNAIGFSWKSERLVSRITCFEVAEAA